MASQTESQKAGTEETKGMEKDKANRTVEEDKKSEDDTATNEQTDNKQTKKSSRAEPTPGRALP